MSRKGHIPIRMCAGCHRRSKKEDLIRLVKDTEGTLLIDESGKAAGRGYYLCPDPACWKVALKKNKDLGGLKQLAVDGKWRMATNRPH